MVLYVTLRRVEQKQAFELKTISRAWFFHSTSSEAPSVVSFLNFKSNWIDGLKLSGNIQSERNDRNYLTALLWLWFNLIL